MGEGLAGASYRSGSFTLDLSGGRLYPLTVDDRIIGAFFDGEGSYTYRNGEPLAATSFATNVKRSTKTKVKDNRLTGAVRSAWILDGTILDQLPGLGESSGAAATEAGAALERFHDRFANDRGTVVSQLLAQALVEGRPGDVSAVLLAGGDDLRYLRDDLRSGEESLAIIERFPSASPLSGQRYLQRLISHPTAGATLTLPPRRWRLTHVDLTLINPSERRLELEVRETVTAETDLKTLAFSLWDSVHDGDDWFPYQLDSVELADGRSVDWTRERRNVLVELPELQAAGDSIELVWQLSGDILYRPRGHSFWWLPIASWLPLPERLDMKHFTYHGVTKVAGGFTPFSIGNTVRRWQEDGLECAEFRLDKPIQFPVVLAGSYNSYEEERDGLTIRLSSYAFQRNDSMKKIAQNTFELIQLYEKLLGDFPFAELNIIEINSFGFGIAPPGVIYLTREAFDPGPEGRRYRAELNQRMAHEVAHQWWGHVAQMHSTREQWLSESTAEYYAAVAIGALLGEHKFRAATRSWKEQSGWVEGDTPVYYANLITGERASRERYGLLYAEGPLMLDDLRRELGDQQFFTIFKSLLRSFPFESVDTGTFIRLTNHVTQQDYGPWLRQRLLGAE